MSNYNEQLTRAFNTARKAVLLAVLLYPVLGFVTCVNRMIRDIPVGENTTSILDGRRGHNNHAYRVYNFGAWADESIKIAVGIAAVGIVVAMGQLGASGIRNATSQMARSKRTVARNVPVPTPVVIDEVTRGALAELQSSIDRRNGLKTFLVACFPAGALACFAVAALVAVSRPAIPGVRPSNTPASNSSPLDADNTVSLPSTFTRSFNGTLSRRIGVKMTLQRSGTSLTGTVTYLKYGVAIPVRGAFSDASSFTLEEFDDKGKHVGNYWGTFVTPSNIQGTWKRPNGEGTMTLELKSADGFGP